MLDCANDGREGETVETAPRTCLISWRRRIEKRAVPKGRH